jgi:hypothetical protein
MLNLLASLLNFILTMLLPLLGLALTAALLAYGAYVRWVNLPQKWLLTRRALQVLCGVALLCNALILLQWYLAKSAKQARLDGAVVRASRERFVLPQDFQYGELRIPAGSLVNRNDPFDQGEPGKPVALHGLEAVRFAQPVEIAGAWVSALQTTPLRLELAQDQTLGPVYRYDSATQTWILHKLVPALACRKGQMAVFQVPHIEYDVQAEVGRPAPDGPEARFKPSEWLLRACENGPAIAVQPAHPGATAPAGQ